EVVVAERQHAAIGVMNNNYLSGAEETLAD
ncbi:MAG: hypothetical protein ACI8Y4_005354, partial [Candidatus Poriferisodalaceae bacterium]